MGYSLLEWYDCAPTSGDLFCTHTSSWWPILYIRMFLKAYSEYIPPHNDLNTTSSYLVFYTGEYYGLLYIYYCLVSLYLYWWHGLHVSLVIYSIHIPSLDDIHGKVFEVLMCTHTSPCLTYSLTSTISSWPSLDTCDFFALFSLFSPWWA